MINKPLTIPLSLRLRKHKPGCTCAPCEAADTLDRLSAENQRLLAVKKAAQELIDYENIGGPDYLHWQERFDALSAALEAKP